MSAITAAEIKSIEEAKGVFLKAHQELRDFTTKASEEIKASGNVATETKNAMEALATKANEAFDRLDVVEARMNRRYAGAAAGEESIGVLAVKSDGFRDILGKKSKYGRFECKTIVNASGQNQPLSPSMRLGGMIREPDRIFRVRDLLMVGRTNSNLIEYAKENVFTNGAAPQYSASPEEREGILKAESNITFTLATAAVVTIAHFLLASKQVLDDSPQLQSYIDGRLMYGLKLEEEDEILNGTGASGELNGILNQATAYNRGATADTAIDTIRKAITQTQLSEYRPNGLVLNPADWEQIELTKDSEGRYIVAQPTALMGPTLWGLPVVPTNTMPANQFLVGAFDMGAQLWDREDANVQVSLEDSDNFRRNLVTIRAEERLALTVYRPAAFIKGAI